MTILWEADFTGSANSFEVGFPVVQRQNVGGAITTSTTNPVLTYNLDHPTVGTMGNTLPLTLGTGMQRVECYHSAPELYYIYDGQERFYRFDILTPPTSSDPQMPTFPHSNTNYFLCVNQLHSINTESSPPLEFDIYNGGLWIRGFNWQTGQYNQFRTKVCDILPATVYSIVYGVRVSSVAANNRINVWADGVKVIDDLAPGFPLIENGGSYWKGATLYVDSTIPKPITVYQNNHAIATTHLDLMPEGQTGEPPLEPEEPWEPNPNGVEMPADFRYVEVHASRAEEFFEPDGGTLVDVLTAAGSTIATDLDYGADYWVRLVAVDFSGNRSEPTAPVKGSPEKIVSVDLGPDSVDTIHIRDAAIKRAQIENLAVNDAKIGNMSVGKLTAGTMTADVTVSGSFNTATDVNNRVRIDGTGIRMTTGGVDRVRILNNGTALITGEFRTALSGQHIVISPSGNQRFYLANGTTFSEMRNTADGMVHSGPKVGVNGQSGFVQYSGFGVGLWYGLENGDRPAQCTVATGNIDIRAPIVGIRVDERFTATADFDNRLQLIHQDWNGDIGASVLNYFRAELINNGPMWHASAMNSAMRFAPQAVQFQTGDGTTNLTVWAGAFNIGSSASLKTPLKEIDPTKEQSLLDKVKKVPVGRFKYLADQKPRPAKPGGKVRKSKGKDKNGEDVFEMVDIEWAAPQPPAKERVGWIAETMREQLPEAVFDHPDNDGTLGINIVDVAAANWGATKELAELVDALTDRIEALEGKKPKK